MIQKKLSLPLGQGHHVIDNGSTQGISRGGAGDELGVDLLVDDDVGELDLVVRQPGLGHARLDSLDLILRHVLDLAMTRTVPE